MIPLNSSIGLKTIKKAIMNTKLAYPTAKTINKIRIIKRMHGIQKLEKPIGIPESEVMK